MSAYLCIHINLLKNNNKLNIKKIFLQHMITDLKSYLMTIHSKKLSIPSFSIKKKFLNSEIMIVTYISLLGVAFSIRRIENSFSIYSFKLETR